jgi:hypothetical protein
MLLQPAQYKTEPQEQQILEAEVVVEVPAAHQPTIQMEALAVQVSLFLN